MPRIPARIPVKELRSHLSDVTDEVAAGRRFIVTRNSKPRMALVPISDLEQLRAMEDRRDKRTIKRRAKEPTTSWEDAKKRLGI